MCTILSLSVIDKLQVPASCKETVSLGHRPVIVKRAVIGSEGGWKLSTIFLSCKVFHGSIIKLGRRVYLCCTF